MTGGNAAVARQVVRAFLGQGDQLLAEIPRLAEQQDAPGLAGHFHKLSGSSRAIGAEAFGQYCKDLELQALDSTRPRIPDAPALERLVEEYRALEALLRDFIDS